MFENSNKKPLFNVSISKISSEEENIVRRYVNPQYFDVNAMINYLNSHSLIGFYIFEECITPSFAKQVTWTYLKVLTLTERSSFIKRIPIYFYDLNKENNFSPSMTDFFEGYKKSILGDSSDNLEFEIESIIDEEREFDKQYTYPEGFNFESLYSILDDVIFKYGVPINKVFEYIFSQVGNIEDFETFEKWHHYISLKDNLSEENVFPANLYFSYNVELEKHGLKPILYYPAETSDDDYIAFKSKDEFIIGGFFPYDQNMKIALKWIAVWTENIEEVSISIPKYSKIDFENFDYKNFREFRPALKTTLRYKLKPDSRIFIANKRIIEKDEFIDENKYEDYWAEHYAGPLKMEFDPTRIVKIREEKGLSPKDISDATGINLRTYQRIENGEGSPDGLNLLKIMNFLDIDSYDELIKRNEIKDDDFEKFRSGKEPSEFIEINEKEPSI